MLDGNAPQLALEYLGAAVGIGGHRQHAALDPQPPAAATANRADHDRSAAVDVPVEQRVQGHDRIVVRRGRVDEVHDDAGLLPGLAARHPPHPLLVDAL
jgi:hypothetical protein